MAKDISKAERDLGLDSVLVSSLDESQWAMGEDVDIACVHSHIPDGVKRGKVIWFEHGTPEYTIQMSMMEAQKGYGAGDSWMLRQYWTSNSDGIVTFCPRHQAIIKAMCDQHTRVECVPMGVDRDFWKPVDSRGKYAGAPSLFTAENCHFIKWPFDLFVIWPWIMQSLPKARLHVNYLPYDQHRWWFPLINSNGASFGSYISPNLLDKESLRNAFCSTDYFIGLVRYGDFNKLCLEAKASGAKVISYKGNPYADYWINEGDQRDMAGTLSAILLGIAEARKADEVPDIKSTAARMKEIYEGL